ncbi:MAG: hypothetical protein WDN08_04910 [Rhizomicrobium sp.]
MLASDDTSRKTRITVRDDRPVKLRDPLAKKHMQRLDVHTSSGKRFHHAAPD